MLINQISRSGQVQNLVVFPQLEKKLSWIKDSASADCALSWDRLPLRIKPIVKNMHSTSTEEALLVRITLASCFKWSRPCAFFQKISGSSSTSSPTFACKYMHLLQYEPLLVVLILRDASAEVAVVWRFHIDGSCQLADGFMIIHKHNYTLHIDIEKRRHRCVYDWRGFKIYDWRRRLSHMQMTDSDLTLNDWRRRLGGGGADHYIHAGGSIATYFNWALKVTFNHYDKQLILITTFPQFGPWSHQSSLDSYYLSREGLCWSSSLPLFYSYLCSLYILCKILFQGL